MAFNNVNPVCWFEIYVDDMQRASKFYETVFQITMESLANPTEDELEMKAFVMNQNTETPGATGALIKMEGFKAGGNSTLVYFTSADCTSEESRVEAAGGKVFKPKFSIGPHGFISLCFDTEGNMFGLHSIN